MPEKEDNQLAKLKIKNFGPIKEGFKDNGGFIEINTLTLICGNQATGKSTIAKLFSMFTWLEKAFIKLTYTTDSFSDDDFKLQCKNQKIHKYFTDRTELEYIGNAYSFIYKKDRIQLRRMQASASLEIFVYHRPKITYIPAERNLLTVLRDAENISNLPPMLSLLQEIYQKALRRYVKKDLQLPVSDLKLRYDENTNNVYIIAPDNSSVSIEYASSGVQSVAPLIVVSKYLSDMITSSFLDNIRILSNSERDSIKAYIKAMPFDTDFVEEAINIIDRAVLIGSKKTDEHEESIITWLESALKPYFNTCFTNIVEEPEQNLYPESQANVLYELISYLNLNEHNRLLITTHSPYLLSFLTLAAKADELLQKGIQKKEIDKIIPSKAAISGKKIHIYETKKDGTIKLVKPYDFLPSDDNELNKALDATNEDFARLLELEEEFCK
ncbi:ATP-binding protein [Treponema denticola]